MIKDEVVIVTVPFRIKRNQVPMFLFLIREAAGGQERAVRIMSEVQVQGKDKTLTGTEALDAYLEKKWKGV